MTVTIHLVSTRCISFEARELLPCGLAQTVGACRFLTQGISGVYKLHVQAVVHRSSDEGLRLRQQSTLTPAAVSCCRRREYLGSEET